MQRCTREGITINTFMLERSPGLVRFVEQMTRINRGRAFFASRSGSASTSSSTTSRRKQKRVG